MQNKKIEHCQPNTSKTKLLVEVKIHNSKRDSDSRDNNERTKTLECVYLMMYMYTPIRMGHT